MIHQAFLIYIKLFKDRPHKKSPVLKRGFSNFNHQRLHHSTHFVGRINNHLTE